ncbi:MAG TPA: NUDIX domain-containing protein, partial [Candidatus Saccharimonadia bacterium]|nr:NUDIX domain-containing protein [Candidatus Saccharimonadia bacterium]
RQTDVDTIHTKGYWHQGIHATVYTNAGEVLFEKRATTMIGGAGLWDLTMGGISSAGEDPDQTVLRELREELGISARPEHVTKLFVWRYNHYLPHYGLHSRSLTHTYLVRVDALPRLALQRSEVETAKSMPFRQAGRFVNEGHSAMGELGSAHRYYRQLLDAAEHQHALLGAAK